MKQNTNQELENEKGELKKIPNASSATSYKGIHAIKGPSIHFAITLSSSGTSFESAIPPSFYYTVSGFWKLKVELDRSNYSV